MGMGLYWFFRISFVVVICLKVAHGEVSISESASKNKNMEKSYCLDKTVEDQILLEAKVNRESFPKEEDCLKSYTSKLARILYRLKALRVDLPDLYGDHEVLKDIEDPWLFFNRSFKNIVFFNSKKAYASYDTKTHQMNLSHAFFSVPEIASLGMLIHEASHGRAEDPGHSECQGGDLRFTYGACDSQLSGASSEASGYNYHFWFLWMVSRYSTKISKEERLYLKERSEYLLVSRFNYVTEFASRNDLILFQEKSGGLYLLDPLFKEAVDIGLNKKLGIKSKNLLNNYRTSGALFVNNEGEISGWDLFSGVINKVQELPFIKDMFPIQSYGAGYDFDINITRTNVVSRSGVAWILKDRESDGISEFVAFEKVNQYGKVDQIDLIIGRRLVVKYKNGDVRTFSVDDVLGNNEVYISEVAQVIPDYLKHNIYFLNKDGELYFAEKNIDYVVYGSSNFKGFNSVKVNIPFLKGNGVKKFQEGINHRGLIDEFGDLYFREYSKSSGIKSFENDFSKFIWKEEVSDFIFISNTSLDNDYEMISEERHFKFKKLCGVEHIAEEPWLNRLMGLSDSGEIIIWDKGVCRRWKSGVSSFRVDNSPFSESRLAFLRRQVFIDFQNGTQEIVKGYASGFLHMDNKK